LWHETQDGLAGCGRIRTLLKKVQNRNSAGVAAFQPAMIFAFGER
jgi:hypothetical protein